MNTKAAFQHLRQTQLPAILELLDDVVAVSSPVGSSIATMCGYHLHGGGKRLRALLPLLVGEALGQEPETLRAFGAACEMLHNATLVHDDLQDGDEVRRGRPAVWRRYGSAQAINAGDAMFYYAVLLLQRLEVPSRRREKALERLLLDTLRVIEGQERELALRQQARPSMQDYLAMVEGKTSGLFSLPMAGAAELSGASADVVVALEEAAAHLGVVFQIQDDVLDLYGDKGRGSHGSDIGEGKRSILVVHALGAAASDDARWLAAVLDKAREETTAQDVTQAAALFRSCGSLHFALREVADRRARAVEIVASQDEPALARLVDGLCSLFLEPIAAFVGTAGLGEDDEAAAKDCGRMVSP